MAELLNQTTEPGGAPPGARRPARGFLFLDGAANSVSPRSDPARISLRWWRNGFPLRLSRRWFAADSPDAEVYQLILPRRTLAHRIAKHQQALQGRIR